ncbi:MAG: tetratricopeptide repeat protein [Candidatus Longimicrobiales bacterium M2_2A_002]
MTSIAKLKDKARKHEQKENWQAAIEVYQKVLDQQDESENLDLDLGLYNRIGDLNLRLGQTDEAVSYYEKAADKYAESGFYNNAIALCNKALRHRPDRAAIYLKLSRLCHEQGFHTDARRWILEYAERKVAAGEVEAALTGLEEFAGLSGDPEIRELLAQHLASHGRDDAAVDQLRTAYAMRVRAGQTDQAAAVADRAREIDPGVELDAEESDALPGLGEDEATGTGAPPEGGDEVAGAGVAGELETTVDEVEPPTGTEAIEGLETVAGAPVEEDDEPEVDEIEGLESTATEVPVAGDEAEEVSGLEVSYGEPEPAAAGEAEAGAVGGLETFGGDEPAGPDTGDEAGAAGAAGAEPIGGEGEEGSQDFDSEEDAEPLPLLATGHDEEEEAGPAEEVESAEELEAAEEVGAEDEIGAPEAEGLDEESVPETGAEESVAAEEPGSGGLELSFERGEPLEAEQADVPEHLDVEGAFDLDEIDLGFSTGGEGSVEGPIQDLDIEATLERARTLVSRALTEQALRELKLLSATDAGPEVFEDAMAVVTEILRHNPNDMEALQRRVQYAERVGDRQLQVDVHLDLAEALERVGSGTKARVIYQRVLQLDPSNEVAREAVGAVEEDDDADGVDLNALVRGMAPEGLEEAVTEGGETDPDLAAMLDQFRAKVAENVAPEDADDHYDLGLAFKEMGLIDEAIAEFQTALTAGEERLKVYEELGQCFVQKGQYLVAVKVFERALKVPHREDDELLGVYYHLGQCYEELGRREDARAAYEKVLSIDETFADVPDRVARL